MKALYWLAGSASALLIGCAARTETVTQDDGLASDATSEAVEPCIVVPEPSYPCSDDYQKRYGAKRVCCSEATGVSCAGTCSKYAPDFGSYKILATCDHDAGVIVTGKLHCTPGF